MAARPRVGVTGHGRRWAPSWWFSWLILRALGARAVRISVRHPAVEETLDALVIGGGDDIGPEQYGGGLDTRDAKVKLDPQRDILESRWIRKALATELPLLGICRGAQLINVVLGGTLHRDLRELRKCTHNRPGLLPTKTVQLESDSLLRRICGRARIRVNSLHHQAIDSPGENLRIVARDLDGICQAIESSEERAVLGVQWHPEYLPYLAVQRALFAWLLSQCAD